MMDEFSIVGIVAIICLCLTIITIKGCNQRSEEIRTEQMELCIKNNVSLDKCK